MEIYRITHKKWAKSLNGSGYPARWNSKGKFAVYCAGSIALAALENVVHRSGEGLNQNFKLVELKVAVNLKQSEIKLKDLPKDWHTPDKYDFCQDIGDEWIRESKTCILKIPSAIIPMEFNYLLNPGHVDFSKIKIKSIHDFVFDPRLIK